MYEWEEVGDWQQRTKTAERKQSVYKKEGAVERGKLRLSAAHHRAEGETEDVRWKKDRSSLRLLKLEQTFNQKVFFLC